VCEKEILKMSLKTQARKKTRQKKIESMRLQLGIRFCMKLKLGLTLNATGTMGGRREDVRFYFAFPMSKTFSTILAKNVDSLSLISSACTAVKSMNFLRSAPNVGRQDSVFASSYMPERRKLSVCQAKLGFC